MTSKRALTPLGVAVAAFLVAVSTALAVPTVTTSVVSGDPAVAFGTFDVLVSISGSPTTGSVESVFFKVKFDSRRTMLTGAAFVTPGFGGLLDPVITAPGPGSPFPVPPDPSPAAFRNVAAADLAGTNTLTDGALLLLTFTNLKWPAAPLNIQLDNPDPQYIATPAEPALIYEVIGSPGDLREEFAPIYDNALTIPIGALDTDLDGKPDFAEFFTPGAGQTNLNISDSDGDGLNDYEEDAAGTNPRSKDSDGDGLWDSLEILLGTDPTGVTNTVVDADADGLPASVNDDAGDPIDLSVIGGADPNESNIDTDSDGYTDGYETVIFYDSTAANNAGVRPTLGDVNNDASINPTDALITLRLFGGAIFLPNAAIKNKQAFDVNRDGQINPTDALIMLRRFGGQVTTLPIPK